MSAKAPRDPLQKKRGLWPRGGRLLPTPPPTTTTSSSSSSSSSKASQWFTSPDWVQACVALVRLFRRFYKWLGGKIKAATLKVIHMVKHKLSPLSGSLLLSLSTIAALVVCAPTLQFNLAAGAILGVSLGSVVMIIGLLCGGIVNFAFSRYYSREWAEEQLQGLETLAALDDALSYRGAIVVALLRLCPVFPFGAVSYTLGASSVDLRDYIVGTFFGQLPIVYLIARIGSMLEQLSSESSRFRRVALRLGILSTAAPIVGLAYCASLALKEAAERPDALKVPADPNCRITQSWKRIDETIPIHPMSTPPVSMPRWCREYDDSVGFIDTDDDDDEGPPPPTSPTPHP